MADPEHLKILKEGGEVERVERWNAWREAHPGLVPDLNGAHFWAAFLSGADLRGADLRRTSAGRTSAGRTSKARTSARRTSARRILREAHLSAANLSDAQLAGADLNEADLSEAILREAHLSAANLSDAQLAGADLNEADLSEAILREADLGGANLYGANLCGANLNGAILFQANLRKATFSGTVFGDSNLTAASGLAECEHIGPSILDHQTIAKSGELPLSFLRGVGLPDWLIDTYRGYLGSPIQFYSCFISYATEDLDFAERLYADLQNKGVRCWFAPQDMKTGDRIRKALEGAIRMRDKLLVVLTETSITKPWVIREIEEALDQEARLHNAVLFPIRLDDAIFECDEDWAISIRDRHIGDFRSWQKPANYKKAFERLLRDLKAEKGEAGD